MAYPPFLLARLCATIDNIAEGRFGWNIVTSGEDTAAQNFGLDKLPPREVRYAMAHEYMDVVTQLWDSWQDDAIIKDGRVDLSGVGALSRLGYMDYGVLDKIFTMPRPPKPAAKA